MFFDPASTPCPHNRNCNEPIQENSPGITLESFWIPNESQLMNNS